MCSRPLIYGYFLLAVWKPSVVIANNKPSGRDTRPEIVERSYLRVGDIHIDAEIGNGGNGWRSQGPPGFFFYPAPGLGSWGSGLGLFFSSLGTTGAVFHTVH